MITPITRKELYLAKIIGEDVDIPETAKTREELFFLKILDNFSKIPEPITREELFLAKISGQDVELPEPKTRLELFLAKAAGVEIETPTPITREEIFWSNYSAIVGFEVEGVPPLTYKAIEGTLENYRIYGNTVGGAGVGDLVESGEHAGEYKVPVTVSNGTDTQAIPIYLPEQIRKVGDEAEYIDYAEQKMHRVRKNLFYITKFTNNDTQSTTHGVTFSIIDNEVYVNGTSTVMYPQASGFDYVLTEGETYAATLYIEGEYTGLPYIYCTTTYDSAGNYQRVPPNVRTIFTALPDTRILFVAQGTGESFNIKYKLLITKATIEDDTYEPYIENTDLDVTLPALPTLTGTNVLSVGTAVQPSKVYVKYKGERQ